MEEQPVIYSLDLGNNPICPDGQTHSALMRLLKALAPVCWVFLNNTGFNDGISRSVDFSLRDSFCLRHLDLRNNELGEQSFDGRD